ncbi:Hypothetical protein, putative [Bodo saltans]|uniref:Uncharacterized protein n=1 Tax=Bodo saltans TaxID=75058 RepID=A0A0S4J7T9_BODSA|nr:Hypothetical protein, putative [Bodo saltans]|eukprot:CUG86033.1 Hypothetical protein, putative [Bodo saltans]
MIRLTEKDRMIARLTKKDNEEGRTAVANEVAPKTLEGEHAMGPEPTSGVGPNMANNKMMVKKRIGVYLSHEGVWTIVEIRDLYDFYFW